MIFEYVGRGRSGGSYRMRRGLSPRQVIARGTPPTHVFLLVAPGEWALVHVCVLRVTCPHCNAKPGKLCSGKDGVILKRDVEAFLSDEFVQRLGEIAAREGAD